MEKDLRDGMKCLGASIYIGGWGRRRFNGYLVVINSGKVLDFVNWGGMNRVAGRRKGAGFRRQGAKISQPEKICRGSEPAKFRKGCEISQPLRKLDPQPAKPCFIISTNPVKQNITLMNKSKRKVENST